MVATSLIPYTTSVKMTPTADVPTEFLSLEADFIDNKMAINNSIRDILRGGGMCIIQCVVVTL